MGSPIYGGLFCELTDAKIGTTNLNLGLNKNEYWMENNTAFL